MARTFRYKKGSAGYERQKARPVSREVREEARDKALEIVGKMQEHRTGRRFQQVDEGAPGIHIPKGTALYAIEKHQNGRPSIYDPLRFPHIAYVLCKERGFTNEELARVFDVSISTVNQWMWQRKEFKLAVRKGRDEFDTGHVEQALLKRALGYEYTEKHVSRTKIVGKTPDGVEVSVPAVTTTEITKHVQADPRSIFYWLQNRQPERWKHTMHIKVDQIPTDEEPEEMEMDIEDMDVTELLALRDMATKAVELKGKTIDITAPEKRLPSVEEVLQAADRLAEHDRVTREAEEANTDKPQRRGK